MSTQHHSLVTVTLDGAPLGIFDSRTGGEKSGEVTKYRPGGMARQKTRSALPEYADVVVSRSWERERDSTVYVIANARAGRGAIVISDQDLDDDGSPYGKPKVWTGRLMTVNGGDSDAESNDPKVLELTAVVTEGP